MCSLEIHIYVPVEALVFVPIESNFEVIQNLDPIGHQKNKGGGTHHDNSVSFKKTSDLFDNPNIFMIHE